MFSSVNYDKIPYTSSVISFEEEQDPQDEPEDEEDEEEVLRKEDVKISSHSGPPRPSDLICKTISDDKTAKPQRKVVYTQPVPPPIEEEDSDASEGGGEPTVTKQDSQAASDSAKSDKKKEDEVPELTKTLDRPAVCGDQDSDEDILLNSDDDYEGDRDDFFRTKKKQKALSLEKMKGVSTFKNFLAGTSGEKNWLFWMDIERARGIQDEAELKG